MMYCSGLNYTRAFVSLAIGLVSYSIVQFFFDKYINLALQQVALMGDVAALMAIAQLDHAVSVVIGALSIKGFFMATKLALGSRG